MALDLVLRDEEQTEYTLHFFHASDLPDNPLVVVSHEVFAGPLGLAPGGATAGVGAPTVDHPEQKITGTLCVDPPLVSQCEYPRGVGKTESWHVLTTLHTLVALSKGGRLQPPRRAALLKSYYAGIDALTAAASAAATASAGAATSSASGSAEVDLKTCTLGKSEINVLAKRLHDEHDGLPPHEQPESLLSHARGKMFVPGHIKTAAFSSLETPRLRNGRVDAVLAVLAEAAHPGEPYQRPDALQSITAETSVAELMSMTTKPGDLVDAEAVALLKYLLQSHQGLMDQVLRDDDLNAHAHRLFLERNKPEFVRQRAFAWWAIKVKTQMSQVTLGGYVRSVMERLRAPLGLTDKGFELVAPPKDMESVWISLADEWGMVGGHKGGVIDANGGASVVFDLKAMLTRVVEWPTYKKLLTPNLATNGKFNLRWLFDTVATDKHGGVRTPIGFCFMDWLGNTTLGGYHLVAYSNVSDKVADDLEPHLKGVLDQIDAMNEEKFTLPCPQTGAPREFNHVWAADGAGWDMAGRNAGPAAGEPLQDTTANLKEIRTPGLHKPSCVSPEIQEMAEAALEGVDWERRKKKSAAFHGVLGRNLLRVPNHTLRRGALHLAVLTPHSWFWSRICSVLVSFDLLGGLQRHLSVALGVRTEECATRRHGLVLLLKGAGAGRKVLKANYRLFVCEDGSPAWTNAAKAVETARLLKLLGVLYWAFERCVSPYSETNKAKFFEAVPELKVRVLLLQELLLVIFGTYTPYIESLGGICVRHAFEAMWNNHTFMQQCDDGPGELIHYIMGQSMPMTGFAPSGRVAAADALRAGAEDDDARAAEVEAEILNEKKLRALRAAATLRLGLHEMEEYCPSTSGTSKVKKMCQTGGGWGRHSADDNAALAKCKPFAEGVKELKSQRKPAGELTASAALPAASSASASEATADGPSEPKKPRLEPAARGGMGDGERPAKRSNTSAGGGGGAAGDGTDDEDDFAVDDCSPTFPRDDDGSLLEAAEEEAEEAEEESGGGAEMAAGGDKVVKANLARLVIVDGKHEETEYVAKSGVIELKLSFQPSNRRIKLSAMCYHEPTATDEAAPAAAPADAASSSSSAAAASKAKEAPKKDKERSVACEIGVPAVCALARVKSDDDERADDGDGAGGVAIDLCASPSLVQILCGGKDGESFSKPSTHTTLSLVALSGALRVICIFADASGEALLARALKDDHLDDVSQQADNAEAVAISALKPPEPHNDELAKRLLRKLVSGGVVPETLGEVEAKVFTLLRSFLGHEAALKWLGTDAAARAKTESTDAVTPRTMSKDKPGKCNECTRRMYVPDDGDFKGRECLFEEDLGTGVIKGSGDRSQPIDDAKENGTEAGFMRAADPHGICHGRCTTKHYFDFVDAVEKRNAKEAAAAASAAAKASKEAAKASKEAAKASKEAAAAAAGGTAAAAAPAAARKNPGRARSSVAHQCPKCSKTLKTLSEDGTMKKHTLAPRDLKGKPTGTNCEASLKLKPSRTFAVDAKGKEIEPWVQCDECEKWRKLPSGAKLPAENAPWDCTMNTDPARNKCDKEEEAWDEESAADAPAPAASS